MYLCVALATGALTNWYCTVLSSLAPQGPIPKVALHVSIYPLALYFCTSRPHTAGWILRHARAAWLQVLAAGVWQSYPQALCHISQHTYDFILDLDVTQPLLTGFWNARVNRAQQFSSVSSPQGLGFLFLRGENERLQEEPEPLRTATHNR